MLNDSAIRLLVVDDHEMFREGLIRMLEKESGFRVTGQAGSASEALGILKETTPTLVLLDVDLGSERAIDFVHGARRARFEGRVLIVTGGISDAEAVQLVHAGVSGIIHKQHSFAKLRETIFQVSGGEVSIENVYLSPVLRSLDRTRKPKSAMLTPRDKAVVSAVLNGLTNREMALTLAISEAAIKASLRHVCAKLGVRTRSQLVKTAIEQYKDQL
jgi:two-component system nitrate/nitrite response regulator NarL